MCIAGDFPLLRGSHDVLPPSIPRVVPAPKPSEAMVMAGEIASLNKVGSSSVEVA